MLKKCLERDSHIVQPLSVMGTTFVCLGKQVAQHLRAIFFHTLPANQTTQQPDIQGIGQQSRGLNLTPIAIQDTGEKDGVISG